MKRNTRIGSGEIIKRKKWRKDGREKIGGRRKRNGKWKGKREEKGNRRKWSVRREEEIDG